MDFLRGYAICLVMLNHFTLLIPSPDAGDWWMRLIKAGGGVDLFFLISGFLVTHILLRAKQSGSRSLRSIYASRILRVWPLYFLVVAFSLGILPLFDHPRADEFDRITGDEWYYFFFLQTIPIATAGSFRHTILDITWSLAIQEQFFWLWPLAVWHLRKATLIMFCVGICVLALGFRIALAAAEISPVAIYVLTPCRLDILAVGCLLALTQSMWTRPEFLTQWTVAVGCVVAGSYIVYGSMQESLWDYTFLTVGLSLRLLAWMAVVILLVNLELRHRAIARTRGVRLFVWISTFGYGLYLTHIPVRALVRDLFFRGSLETGPAGPLVNQLLFYVVAFPACLTVGILIFTLFEKPILQLKNRWFQGHAKIKVSES